MELAKAMKEFVEIKAKIKELKATQEQLRTDILIEVKINDIDKFETDTERLRLISQTRKTFDKKKAVEYIESKGDDSSAFYTESDFEILKVDSRTDSDESTAQQLGDE